MILPDNICLEHDEMALGSNSLKKICPLWEPFKLKKPTKTINKNPMEFQWKVYSNDRFRVDLKWDCQSTFHVLLNKDIYCIVMLINERLMGWCGDFTMALHNQQQSLFSFSLHVLLKSDLCFISPRMNLEQWRLFAKTDLLAGAGM